MTLIVCIRQCLLSILIHAGALKFIVVILKILTHTKNILYILKLTFFKDRHTFLFFKVSWTGKKCLYAFF